MIETLRSPVPFSYTHQPHGRWQASWENPACHMPIRVCRRIVFSKFEQELFHRFLKSGQILFMIRTVFVQTLLVHLARVGAFHSGD